MAGNLPFTEGESLLTGYQNVEAVQPIRSRRIISVGAAFLLVGASSLVALSRRGKASTAADNSDKKVQSLDVNTPAAIMLDSEASSSRASQPHIILFTVDDMGWNDIGYRSTDLPNATTFMTELSEKSIILTQYYTQPSCTPSRATIMSGKWAYKNGFQNYELHISDPVGLPLKNKLMPEFMVELGYKTHMIGKWNIGHCNERYLPTYRGFEKFLGYHGPGHGYYNYGVGSDQATRDMMEGKSKYDDKAGKFVDHSWKTGESYLGTYDTELYRIRTTTYIEEHREKYLDRDEYRPFFMWAAHHGIHSEMDEDPIPPTSMLTKADSLYLKHLDSIMHDDGDDDHKIFFAMRKVTASVLMAIDFSLRHLVNSLEENGMLMDTVLLVNSDNGGDTIYTKGHPGNNYPLRSAKFQYFEGGIRVPAFIYAPWVKNFEANFGGKEYRGLMHHVDLLPTFVHIGQGELDTNDYEIDGYNMWPSILGTKPSPRTELWLNLPRNKDWDTGERKTEEGIAVRLNDYKLLLNHVYDEWFSPDVNSQDWHTAATMYSLPCMYSFYGINPHGSFNCTFGGYLFNVVKDPDEKHNLIGRDDHKDLVMNMISRVYEVISIEGDNYGSVVYQYWSNKDESSRAADAFTESQDFVVPWDCDTIA